MLDISISLWTNISGINHQSYVNVCFQHRMNDFEWMDVEICWKSQFPQHHFGQIYLHSVIALLTKSWVVLRTFELLVQIGSNWCQLPSDWANLNISYIKEMSRCLTLQRKNGREADAALTKIGSNWCQVTFCQRANPDSYCINRSLSLTLDCFCCHLLLYVLWQPDFG